MRKKHKVLMTALVIGLAGALGGFGIFAAFSSTTTNPGNSFAAGTVTLSDNDGGTALFNASNQKPGDNDRCIKVTYTGTLDATVKLYSSAITGDGSSFNVTVTKGAGDAADCSDFVAGSDVYASNTLANFSGSHSNFTNGLAVNPGAATKWVTNDAVTFRFRVTVPDDNSVQGDAVDPFTLTWEAQNQ
jgi:hypothetical protein